MDLFSHLSQTFEFKILRSENLAGGDISEVFLLDTDKGKFVLKVNVLTKLQMFQNEQKGLRKLQQASSIIRVPKTFEVNYMKDKSYLLMEYIQPGKAKGNSFKLLAEGVAEIHQNKQEFYGNDEPNFIGELPQTNTQSDHWSLFYWDERIKPQLDLAVTNAYLTPEELPLKEEAIDVFNQYFSFHKPALLHGDLWNGNYFFDEQGNPVLIDPSVYYGHPIMDIAMAHLFGGFNNEFFAVYHKINDLGQDLKPSIELAQLYYLLVHLNLFGRGYLPSVNAILKKYFFNI